MARPEVFEVLEELYHEFEELRTSFSSRYPVYMPSEADINKMVHEFNTARNAFVKRWRSRDDRWEESWVVRLLFDSFWNELLSKSISD